MVSYALAVWDGFLSRYLVCIIWRRSRSNLLKYLAQFLQLILATNESGIFKL